MTPKFNLALVLPNFELPNRLDGGGPNGVVEGGGPAGVVDGFLANLGYLSGVEGGGLELNGTENAMLANYSRGRFGRSCF